MKPKFNIKDYPGKYGMRVTSAIQAKIFCEYLHKAGKKWLSGTSYLDKTMYEPYLRSTFYYFNKGIANYANCNDGHTILEFNDFDWSDFMKKDFTKADLKNGDVVKRGNGDIEIVCVDTGTLIRKDGDFNSLDNVKNDLTTIYNIFRYDIIAVRRPLQSRDCSFDAFDNGYGELVYERKEPEEMTLEEVCKALGKDIKIVKEHK